MILFFLQMALHFDLTKFIINSQADYVRIINLKRLLSQGLIPERTLCHKYDVGPYEITQVKKNAQTRAQLINIIDQQIDLFDGKTVETIELMSQFQRGYYQEDPPTLFEMMQWPVIYDFNDKDTLRKVASYYQFDIPDDYLTFQNLIEHFDRLLIWSVRANCYTLSSNDFFNSRGTGHITYVDVRTYYAFLKRHPELMNQIMGDSYISGGPGSRLLDLLLDMHEYQAVCLIFDYILNNYPINVAEDVFLTIIRAAPALIPHLTRERKFDIARHALNTETIEMLNYFKDNHVAQVHEAIIGLAYHARVESCDLDLYLEVKGMMRQMEAPSDEVLAQIPEHMKFEPDEVTEDVDDIEKILYYSGRTITQIVRFNEIDFALILARKGLIAEIEQEISKYSRQRDRLYMLSLIDRV